MKSKNSIRESASRKIFLICNGVFFLIITFVCFYPLWYVFVQSLSNGNQAVNALAWPVGFTLNNYVELLKMDDIFRAFLISVARTLIGTVTHVICCMYAGYLFTKEDMPLRKLCYRIMVITMYVSGGLIPTFLTIKAYGLMNNFWVYILPSLISAYDVILIKTFVEQLPAELEESARIDGANTMRVFLSIILPLSLPIVATISIYASNSQWNSWFDCQLYTVNTESLYPLQYLLYNYLNRSEELLKQLREADASDALLDKYMTPRGIKMTVTMISTIPILCVYPFMQRYLVKGIMIGAVKG